MCTETLRSSVAQYEHELFHSTPVTHVVVLCRHQQTTVEEQSRIMQLEEELATRRAEIKNLQAQLTGSDTSSQQPGDVCANVVTALGSEDLQTETLPLREQHFKECSELKERYETALAGSQQEIESLKATAEKQTQEISELKQKVQQANKENMEMMDTWKVR